MKPAGDAAGVMRDAEARRAGAATVTPLRKRRLTGEFYTRDPKIEALIAGLRAVQ